MFYYFINGEVPATRVGGGEHGPKLVGKTGGANADSGKGQTATTINQAMGTCWKLSHESEYVIMINCQS